VSENFWNLRGSYRVGGVLDIGTHCSLVRRTNGEFVLLDAYTLDPAALDQLLSLTDGGRALTAVLHVHPFHTLHVTSLYKHFPAARLYGTSRHLARFPDLPWRPERTEDPELHALFGADLEFSIPAGVAFVPSDPRLHFSSVLVFHPASRTLHVDDTLMYNPLPWIGGITFHPTLSQVLEPRADAASQFRTWAEALAKRCEQVDHLCVAHAGTVPAMRGALGQAVLSALRKVEPTLSAHEKKWRGR
jgi:hypothetical protein